MSPDTGHCRVVTRCSSQNYLGQEMLPRKDLIYTLHWHFELSVALAAASVSPGGVSVP